MGDQRGARAADRGGAGAGGDPRLTRTRSRRGEGNRLRSDILAAAERLLVETGDEEAVSVRAIADAAGCAPPSIYLHFADKTELIREVCEQHFDELDARSESAAAGCADPVEALRRRALAYVEFGRENPEHYRILFMGRREETTAGHVAFAHLVDAVQRCIDAGAFVPDDASVVATGLWSVVHGVTSLTISFAGFPMVGLERLLDHVLRVQCTGLSYRNDSTR